VKIQVTENRWGELLISNKAAGKLAAKYNKKPPKYGYELLVEFGGHHYWLTKWYYDCKMRWLIRPTSWRLEGNIAKLG
jgi:hypothetical protein